MLLEKAGYLENDFIGNEYTEFGNVIEPKIRDFINESEKDKFVENKIIEDDLRYHSDGVNKTTVLEIKSTSQIKEDVSDYTLYLVQLLLGMKLNKMKKGKLAIYERPEDFNTEFDESRLTIYDINIKDYKELLEDIETAIEQFRIDLKKVKENPLITEEDLQPKEVIELSNQIVEIENQLIAFKELEKSQKKLKEQLKKAMEEYQIKKWETPNGTKITLVADGEDKEVEVIVKAPSRRLTTQEFGIKKWTTPNGTKITLVNDGEDKKVEIKKVDTEKFEKENADLISDFNKMQEKYNEVQEKYTTTEKEIKKGRKGYVKITLEK